MPLRTPRDRARSRRAAIAIAVAAGLAAAAAGTGCATRLPPAVTAADAERAGMQLSALDEGRTLLIRKCGNCHRAPLPAEYSAGDWPVKLDEMSARANLDPGQRLAIERYLVVMAEAPPAPATRAR